MRTRGIINESGRCAVWSHRLVSVLGLVSALTVLTIRARASLERNKQRRKSEVARTIVEDIRHGKSYQSRADLRPRIVRLTTRGSASSLEQSLSCSSLYSRSTDWCSLRSYRNNHDGEPGSMRCLQRVWRICHLHESIS